MTPTLATPEAQQQAIGQGGAHRPERQCHFVIGKRELRLMQQRRSKALERGQQQCRDRQHHGEKDIECADAEQQPGQSAHIHHARPEGLAGDGGEAATTYHPAIEGQHGEHDDE